MLLIAVSFHTYMNAACVRAKRSQQIHRSYVDIFICRVHLCMVMATALLTLDGTTPGLFFPAPGSRLNLHCTRCAQSCGSVLQERYLGVSREVRRRSQPE